MVGDDCILAGGVEPKAIYTYIQWASLYICIIYIFGGNCSFGSLSRSTTSPQKNLIAHSPQKKNDAWIAKQTFPVEIVPYRSGLSFTPLGEPTDPKVGTCRPFMLVPVPRWESIVAGGVCRFEVNSHYFIFCYWNLPTSKNQLQNSPPEITVDPFILPHFLGTKKKNGLHLRGWTFGGQKFRENLPVALGPGHSSAGYLRFMTSITSFATSRCTETGKPAGCSWRKWRQALERLGNFQKKSLIQSRNGDATSFFLLEAPQKNTYCIRYVLQTKCRNESNTV